MARKIVLGLLAAAALAAASLFAYYQLVKAGYLRYNRYDRHERGALEVGQAAPDLALESYAGERLQLSALWKERPLFLIFGSCT
jgi:hypothetical protein